MQRVLIVLFCCLFSVSAQAGISDCVTALKNAINKNVYGVDQKTADRLTNAIIEGDTDTIKELAKPWLNLKNHDYSFGRDGNRIVADTSNNPLILAIQVAFEGIYLGTDRSINSLKTLVNMGFRFSATSDKEKAAWARVIQFTSTNNPSVSEKQKEILNILVDAGLSVKKLYLSNGRSIVHRQLIMADTVELEILLSSNFITKEDINVQLHDPMYDGLMYKTFVNKDTISGFSEDFSLLQLYAKISNPKGIPGLKILLAHGADPNLAASFRDTHMGRAIVMTPLEVARRAGNDRAVELLLKAGAKEATEESEDRNLLEKK